MSPRNPKTQEPHYPAEIFDHIRRIVRALRVTSREAEKRLGVTAAQLFVLQRLKEKNPMTLKEVAEATLTDSSTVSAVVQHLVEKRLIERGRSETDRREIQLTLSPLGLSLLKKSFSSFQETLCDAIQEMPLGSQKSLARLLEEVCERSGIAEKPLTMFFEGEDSQAKKGKIRNRVS